MTCPLCGADGCRTLFRDKIRDYVRCRSCGLVFVPQRFHVGLTEERRRYDLHRNDDRNDGYVRFLVQVADVVACRRTPGDRVLDFGCGKEAVLTKLLTERNFDCIGFDPLYGIGDDALASVYDAVVLCEVVEHLRDLLNLAALLRRITKPSGHIVIRTRLYPEPSAFAGWWYKNDVTHINFFNRSSIDLLARETGRKALAEAEDIFVFGPAC